MSARPTSAGRKTGPPSGPPRKLRGDGHARQAVVRSRNATDTSAGTVAGLVVIDAGIIVSSHGLAGDLRCRVARCDQIPDVGRISHRMRNLLSLAPKCAGCCLSYVRGWVVCAILVSFPKIHKGSPFREPNHPALSLIVCASVVTLFCPG